MARANKVEAIERATSPIDERILGGRRYIVYEGKHHAEDVESYRKGLYCNERCFTRGDDR